MPRISLVIPIDASARPTHERLIACCAELGACGHEFEVLLVSREPVPDLGHLHALAEVCVIQAKNAGLAPAVVSGLEAARGDAVVILDEGMGYELKDVGKIIEPLLAEEAELVIGSRFTRARGGWRSLVGRCLRALVGTTDPLSGLIGVRKSAFREASGRLAALGSKFSFELLAKVEGRVVDAPVRRPHPRRNDWPRWDDVRHWKRLADHRFGNFSRLIQFCLVGASGMFVDLSTYALFQWILAHTPLEGRTIGMLGFSWPMPLAIAAVIAVLLALAWNFTLNRRLTFNDARSGSIIRQFFTYALSNAISVPLSLFLRLQLPEWSGFFRRHRLAAAVAGIVAATSVSFSMARWIVFRQPKRPSRSEHDQTRACSTIPDPLTSQPVESKRRPH
jgi:dolichol-phosphate mannosyltransferase